VDFSRDSKTRKYLGILVMLAASSLASILFASVPKAVYATGPDVDLGAMVITCSNDGSGFYAAPYDQQIAQNMMRNWGIPFNTTDVSAINSETFWDSVNHINKYQFLVYFGCTSFSTEPTLSSTIRSAVAGAIANGTNAIFVGAGVYNWMNLFGLSLSGTGDCPPDPQAGGSSCFTPGYVLKFGIESSFCGIVMGDTCWVKGAVYNANNTADWPSGTAVPDVNMPTLSWNGTHGAEFMNATANDVVYPNTIYRDYGSNHAQIWWYGATEGLFADYLQGWAGTFDNTEFSDGCAYGGCSYYQGFAPEVQLFYYALNNVTRYPVSMMPWATYGSAETIRAEDHSSICPTFTVCSTAAGDPDVAGMLSRGVVGEINVDLNGWSNSVPLPLAAGLPPGATNSPCTAGYQYYGRLTTTWDSRYFLTCARVNNATATSTSAISNSITTAHSSTIDISDGNTTTITEAEVLVSTTGSPSWTLSFIDSQGDTLWTSPDQNTSLSSATWVKFAGINFTGTDAGYVNSLQGDDELRVTVTSGVVVWHNQSSSSANYVVTGRGGWDIVYIDPTAGTNDFANATAIMPDSIRMASGSLYPSANSTFYISGVPGLVQPADIVGDGNTGAPTAVNIQTFFNDSDWSTYGATQVSNWRALVALGWQIDTNGWTHAKVASGGYDNDFVYGNGTTMGAAEMAKRVNDIKVMLDEVIGSAYVSADWAFGSAAQTFYPGAAQMVAGGFMEAQLATQDNGTQTFVTAGFYQSSATGAGSLYGIGEGSKVAGAEGWLSSYNETRDMQGIIESHSDSTSPWNDYDQALSIRATQPYDKNSTWFTTTTDALDFWNTTFYALQHTKTFMWDPSTNQVTLTFYTGTSNSIDKANFNDPIVFRLPEALDSLGFTSASDNQTSGNLANSTANWRYYEVDVGHKWTSFTFTFRETTTTLTVNTGPTNLPSGFSFDYATYSSPQTFTVYVNSVHAVSAPSPIGCGNLCEWSWSSWTDSGAQTHEYTVPGAAPTLSAIYAQTSLVPSGVLGYVPIAMHNSGPTNLAKGTQWKVLVDWSAYSSHLASDLGNVVFFGGSGNIWDSWNENASSSSVTNGLVWTLSQVSLASGSTYTIYMGFYPTSTNNYSPTGSWGEAPTLSPTYAQYDNGALVFPAGYWDFAGSSLPSGWTGSGEVVSNGLTVPGERSYAYTTATTYGLNASLALDMYGNITEPSPAGVYSCAGYVQQDGGTTCGVASGRDLAAWALNSGHQPVDAFGMSALTGAGLQYVDGADTYGIQTYTIMWPSASQVSFSSGYGAYYNTAGGQVPNVNLAIGAASSFNDNYNQGLGPFNWMRLRVDGGEFDTSTFGSFTTIFTLTTSAGTGGTVSPSTEGWGSGASVYLQALPSSGYAFNGWTCAGSGCVTGSSNPISVTMNNAISETASFNSHAVTLPLEVCLQEPGATSGTFGLSGAGISATTIVGAYSCSAVDLNVSAASTVVVTVPADGTNARYRMNSSSTSALTEDVPTCSSGTCETVKIDSYYQLNNTYRATPVNPVAWDFDGSVAVSGTIAGSSGQTGCSISTTSGDAAAECTSYFDYGTTVTTASPLAVSSTERWVQSCGPAGAEFSATTGGNLYNCDYGRQWQVAFAVSPSSSYGSVSPSSTSFYNDGTNGTALPVVGTADPGYAFSSWSASSGSITFASPGSPSTTATIEAAGTIDAAFVGRESTQIITVTMSNSAPGATVTINSCATGGNSTFLPDGNAHTYPSFQTSCNFTLSFSNSGTTRDGFSVASAFSATSGSYPSGTPVSVTAYEQTQQAYEITANAQGTFDGGLSFVISGTYLGSGPTTICTLAPASNATDSCAPGASWADYNTAVSFPTNPTGAGAYIRWEVSGTSSFTQTTGGNIDAVNYYKQLQNTYACSPGSPSTFDGTYQCTATGTLLGAGSSTVGTVDTSNGGGAVSFTAYADYGDAVSLPSSLGGWTASGAHSWTDTTGGNTRTATYNQIPTTISQVIIVAMSNSAPSAVVAINTCSTGGNTTFFSDGYSHTYPSFQTSCSFTLSFSNTGTTRDGFSVSGVFAAASGSYASGPSVSVAAYEQTQQTYGVQANAQAKFDALMTFAITGTYLGSGGTTICTLSPSANATDTCSAAHSWADYGLPVSFPAAPTGAPANSRWESTGATSFADLTGGNSHMVQYWKQWTNNFEYSVTDGGSPAAPTLACDQFGSPATLTLESSAQPFYCDNSATASASDPISGGTGERWSDDDQSSTITSGGSTVAFAYYNQYSFSLDYQVIGGGGTSTAPTLTTTQFGNVYTPTLTSTPLTYWLDAGQSWSVTNPLTHSGAIQRWDTSQTTSGTVSASSPTTAGDGLLWGYYDQLDNTYQATPVNPTAWDAGLSIAVTGTQFGSAGQTGCTIATAIGGGPVACAAWFDYDTQATIGSPVSVSANERWAQACGSGAITQTTGGNLDNCNFVMELQNTYACNPSVPSTFNGVYACTATGTLAGVASSTICTVNTASGGGSVNCSGYADYGDAVSLPSSLGGWTVLGTRSWTDTTGGNVLTANYDDVPLTAPTIASSPATIDSGQSSTISTTTSFGGGKSPYTCQWLVEAPGDFSYSDLGASFSCATTSLPTVPTGTLSATGTWSFALKVTDSTPTTVTSNAATVTVNSDLSGVALGSFTTNPVGLGQSDSVPVSWSGGTPTYTLTLYYSTSSRSCSSTNTEAAQAVGVSSSPKTVTFTAPSSAGTYYYCAKATDSAGGSAASSTSGTSLTVAVPAFVAPSITVSPAVVDSGQTSTPSTTTPFSGGIPAYTCQWLEEAPGGSYSDLGSSFTSGCTTSSLPTTSTAALSATGTWHFELQVTDGASKTVTSNVVTVKVDSALVAPMASSSPTTVDRGQSSSLTSTAVTTGTSPYTYQWLAEAPGATSYSAISGATSSSFTFATSASTASGTWHFELQVTDGASKTVTSNAASTTVDSALVASTASSSPSTIDRGQSSSLTSTAVTTGTSPYTYQWLAEAPGATSYSAIKAATSSSYSSASSASTATGTWHFELQVTDGAGAVVTSNSVTVTVNSALAAPTISSSPTTVDRGQSSSLTSTAVTTGTSSYTYQWLAEAPGATSYSAISGATSSSFTFATSASTATGTWHFELQVTDGAGAVVTSNAVAIKVNS
jgi:Divergent InlB B-repeat domain